MGLDKKNIRFRLSGGASNTDPDASLGGVMSTAAGGEIKTKNASKDTNNITGVVLRDVSGDCPDSNGAGKAQLSFTAAGILLKFKKPGGTLGTGVDISGDGVYMVYDNDATMFAIVEVTASSLPGTDQSDDITVAGPLHYLFDAVKKSESWYGDEEFRCLFITNDHEEVSSTVTSSGNNTLTDSSQSWSTDEHMGRFVYITSGTGIGQLRMISGNTSDTLTLEDNWDTNPGVGAGYKIFDKYLDAVVFIETEQEGQLDSGTATGGTGSTLQDTAKNWTVDGFAGKFVRITAGTGKGQSRTIVSNTADTLTVDVNWGTNPSTDSQYSITDNILDIGVEDCAISQEEIDQGDGGTSYSGTLANKPLVSKTLVIEDELSQEKFTDYDGDGNLTGSAGGSGTINYTTGAWTLTYGSALANGTKILADYVKWPQSIANEGTPPTGVSFTHPVSGATLSIGELCGSGYPVQWGNKAVWLRWKTKKTAERTPATARLQFEGRA